MLYTYDNPSVRSLLDQNCTAIPDKAFLKDVILSKESPIAAKLSAISFCRDISTEDATEILLESLKYHFDPLIRHEIVYAIGQAVCFSAWPQMIDILEDESEDFVVRHEAAEALATMKCMESLPVIKKHLNNQIKPIRDTCILSEHSLNQVNESGEPKTYKTIDPIQSNNSQNSKSIDKEAKLLNDSSEKLYTRYKSLFYFRSLNTDESAKIIGEALINDNTSEVFRHECAFVLGQLQNMTSYIYLIKSLENINESPMTRHEAAIALGSVAYNIIQNSKNDELEEIKESLTKFSVDPSTIVANSCIVSLDNINFALNKL